MPPTKKRPPTQRGVHRDYTRTPTHIDPEETPPPQEMPAVARSRTPTPDEIATSFSAIEAQLSTLRDGLVALWPARNVHDEITAMRTEFRGYTQSMAQAEATARGAWEAVKNLMPRLDQLLQGHGAVSQLTESVGTLGEKLDSFGDRFATIDTAQAAAAVRFDEHDRRDSKTAAEVGEIRDDVNALKEARAGDVAVAALTRKQKGGVALLGTAGGGLIALLSKLLGG